MPLSLKLSWKDTAASDAVEHGKPLVIRNPTATVANLRAAVAITLKKDVATFRLAHNDESLLTDTVVLTTILKDGDTVCAVGGVAPKTERAPEPAAEGEKKPRSDDAAAAPAAASGDAPAIPTVSELLGKIRGAREEIHNEMAEAGDGTAPQLWGIDGAASNSDDEEEEEEEVPEMDEEMEEGDWEVESIDLAAMAGDGEQDLDFRSQADLVMALATLPNAEELHTRFEQDPEAVLAEIQRTKPDLYAMIARNYEMFATILEAEDADFLSGAVETTADSDADAGSIPATPGAAPIDGRPPLTDRDIACLENLMQLGFPRDKVEAAYYACGRNPERAAAKLFDDAAN